PHGYHRRRITGWSGPCRGTDAPHTTSLRRSRGADLRIPLREGSRVRRVPADVRRAGRRVPELRVEGAAAVLPRRDRLQGQRLLQDGFPQVRRLRGLLELDELVVGGVEVLVGR